MNEATRYLSAWMRMRSPRDWRGRATASSAPICRYGRAEMRRADRSVGQAGQTRRL